MSVSGKDQRENIGVTPVPRASGGGSDAGPQGLGARCHSDPDPVSPVARGPPDQKHSPMDILGVFLVLALLILANSLGTGKRPDQNVDRAEPGYPQRERVLFWAKHIRWMARRDFPLLGNGEPLRRLILEVVAFQERLSLPEVEQRLESGELDVPPPIRTCLQQQGMLAIPSCQPLGKAPASLGRLSPAGACFDKWPDPNTIRYTTLPLRQRTGEHCSILRRSPEDNT